VNKFSTLINNAENILAKHLRAIVISLIMAAVLFLMPQHGKAQTFTGGNLTLFVAAASASNTTGSIVEINTFTPNQAAVNTDTIRGTTGANPMRFSGSATSTMYLANSNDGTLVCFTGGDTTNTSVNINAVQGRGVGTFNSSGTFNFATSYKGLISGGVQTRGATSINNSTWFVGDQDGFYSNGTTAPSPAGNIRSVKAFGGTVYYFTASASAPAVGTISAATGGTATALPGLPNGTSNRQDFYLVSSGSNGSAYDVLYVLSASSATADSIFKYSLVGSSWVANGNYRGFDGGFGLAAQKNGTGANLYISTGTGASTADSLIKLNDLAGYNATINISPTIVTLYKAAAGTIIKGVAFAPQTSVAVSTSHPAAGNLPQGSTDKIISAYQLAVTQSNARITSLTDTTSGSYVSSDITNFKFWLSTSATSISGATQLGSTITSIPSSGGVLSVTGLTNVLTTGTTYYILVTTTATTSATVGHTLSLTNTVLTNFGIALPGTLTGSSGSSNIQTISAALPTHLVITSTTPTTPVGPTAGGTFSVTVQAQSSINSPANVASNTTVTITNVGGGTLSGTAAQTLSAGSSQVTISGLSLSAAGTGIILNATASGGDVLTAGADTITVYDSMPSVLASNINIGSITSSSVHITWTSGNGDSEIVVARKTTKAAVAPVNGTLYLVNSSSFSDGTNSTTGSGNVVVYKGATPNSGLTVTGLAGGTGYSFDIYEYKAPHALYSYSAATSNSTTSQVATYTWNTSSGNWSSASSWTPSRGTPGSTDILVFDGNVVASPTANIDIADNFAQLIFKNNVNATLSVAVNHTLTVNGDGTSATDLVINSGSTLNGTNSGGAFVLTINIVTGATGQIDGTANFNGTTAAAFKLESVDASSLLVNGTVSVGANFSSNLFGAGTGASGVNSVVFNSGSTYIQGGGANPFGATAPASVVTFNPGSNFKFVGVGSIANPITPSIAQRTYANFEYDAAGNPIPAFTNNTNAGVITGNLLVSGGTLQDTSTANTISIGGNITVNVGDTLLFNFPASSHSGGFTLNGTNDQTITANGAFIMGTGMDILLKKTSGNLKLGSDVTFNNLTFNNTSPANTANVVIGAHTLTFNGAALGTSGGFVGSYASNITCNSDVNLLNFVAGADTLHNLTLSSDTSAAEIGTPLAITAGSSPGTITVASGAFLVLDDSLTLKSDNNGTARVASNPSGSQYIFDNGVTVERYIPANSQRAWRLLSIPTQTTQTIHDSWQEGQAAGVVGTPGLGTNITSPIAGWAVAGFDAQSYSSSMLTYQPTTNKWDSIVNTSFAIATGSGYFLFIRGDRSETVSAGNNTPTNPTVLRTTGELYQGDQTPIQVASGSPSSGFGLIGNIYASAIDFTALTKDAGIDNKFYVWDPKVLNNPPSLGGYVVFSSVTVPAWKPVPGGGSYTAGVPNTAIQSGQAFFIHASSTANIQLTEASKVAGSANVFRPESPSNESGQLSTNLYEVNGSSVQMADGNVEVYNSAYSDAVDGNDALKLSNTQENFGIFRNSSVLIIEARQPVTTTDTIFFKMWNMKQQQYKMEFVPSNLNTTGLTAVLEDSYLGTKTPVDLTNTNSVLFTVDGNAGSSASNRFMVVFNNSSPVAVSFTGISAHQVSNSVGIEVDWKVTGENGVQEYIVERSTNGSSFSQVGVATAKGNNGGAISYSLQDAMATAAGTYYYRIRSVGVNGAVSYTATVKVTIGSGKPSITIYPNPVADGHITVQLTNQGEGVYSLRLLTVTGQSVFKGELVHGGGSGTQTVSLPAYLSKGTYQLEVISPANEVHTQKLTIINKN
jgi:hypothetical protein